jgi:hypothetical protein
MERVVKGIWKKIYLKDGDKVPWSEDEDEDDDEDGDEDDELPSEDDELPLENVQQTEKASSSSFSRERTCAYCGKVGNLDRCAKCKSTFYCSPSHQAADYAKHKADCQAPKTLANDTAQPTNTVGHRFLSIFIFVIENAMKSFHCSVAPDVLQHEKMTN